MKIEKIKIECFRAFNKPYEFSFDRRLSVILGPNGTGKTSLCDAIQWALLGKLQQYDSVEAALEDVIINRNNPKREAKAIIFLSDGKPKTIVERSAKSKKVWKPTRQAKLQVLEGKEIEIIPETFLATVYLRQEELREFIGVKPEKRGPVLSSLLGIEFIVALEKGTEEAVELIKIEERTLKGAIEGRQELVEKYKDEYASLNSSKISIGKKWDLSPKKLEDQLKLSFMISKAKYLFEQLESIGGIIDLKMPMEFKEDLLTVRMFSEKLSGIYGEWKLKISENLTQFETLKGRIEDLKKAIEECDENLINQNIQAIKEKIETREKELGVKDSYSKLLISGEQYFRLGVPKECPLCENKIMDPSITLDRLAIKIKELDERKEIESLYEEIRKLRQEENELKLKLDSLGSWRKEKEGIEKKFNIQEYEKTKKAKDSLETLNKEALLLIDIYNIFKKEQELAQRLPQLPSEDDINNDKKKLEKLTHFYDLVGILCEQIRGISTLFIQQRIESLNPTVNEYANILSPHPTFSRISITYDERGYWLQGISGENEKTYVQTLFSTGQLNEAAVLILLAMAKKALHNLEFVILDDPSQSLDRDGKRRLADLLAKASQDKQIIVSTMDIEFADFIKSSYPKTTFFKFSGYQDEKGPVIEK